MTVRFYKDSSNLLLARFLDGSGAVVTNASEGGTTVTATLTRPDGSVAFAAQAMTYDAAKTIVLPDGTVATGCWKRYCTPAEISTLGRHAAEAVAIGTTVPSGATVPNRRHLYWTVTIVDKGAP